MFQGYYSGALETMLKALIDHGPHVGLLSDLVATYYMAGRLEECILMTDRLERELLLAKPFLSEFSIAKTQIFLGKIYEEQGHLDKALITYDEAIESARSDFQTRVRAQSQILRLKSFLGVKAGLPELYQICLKARAESRSLDIELEHGLMLAEVVLMGPLTAFERVKALSQEPDINWADLRLIVIDFAEEALRQKMAVVGLETILKSMPTDDLDGFEKVIHAMSLSSRLETFVIDTNALAKTLPMMSLLRLLQLRISYCQDSSLIVEMKRKLMFALDGVSSATRSMILKKWNLESAEGTLVLSYRPASTSLFVNGHSLTFKRNSFATKCFDFFKDRRCVTIEEFVASIFDGEYNETYFDRIRMALQRLNKELAPLSGRPKIFVIQKDKVEMIEGVLLQD